MRLTLVYPAMGRIPGAKFIRSWQMEPLGIAQIAALTPKHIKISFWDDRVEPIPYDAPTDLVAISAETYSAKRAYQIASEYRRRGVPVVMGGFHPTLVPDEAAQYAETIVIGEAENVWEQLIDDFQAGRINRIYWGDVPKKIPIPDRSIFANKNYMKISLVETGRGCKNRCDFCSIQSYFGPRRTWRDLDSTLKEIHALRQSRKVFFLVDDNINTPPDQAKDFFKALAKLNIHWISQASLTLSQDEEMLSLMRSSGCEGVLVGVESLSTRNLSDMNKKFNTLPGGPETAMRLIQKHGIKLYPTFVFGYDHDEPGCFNEAVDMCIRAKVFIAAFNHLVPFPGTPLYSRLKDEGRLNFHKWWLDSKYTFGQVPFASKIDPVEIQHSCFAARKRFYAAPSVLRRFVSKTNISDLKSAATYLFANVLLRNESRQRYGYPLGDLGYSKDLLEVPSGKETIAVGEQEMS